MVRPWAGTNHLDEVMAKIDGNAGRNTLYGTPLRDVIDGQGGDDALFGRNGDDLIYGKAGNDRLYGERGIDYLSGGDGDDVLFGQDDRDRLWGDAGDDLIHGGVGNDDLYGGTGDDNLKGNDGNDWLWGGTGWDRLEGGGGHDKLYVGDGGGRVLGGGGNDFIFASNAGVEKTLIDGGAGHDHFFYDFNLGGDDDALADGALLHVNDLITDFKSGEDGLQISMSGWNDEDGRWIEYRDFEGLDSNQDGVIDGADNDISITQASFWGVKADSLTITVDNLYEGGLFTGTITLYGVTELHPGDI
jgi:Ca2+-binding RTX toxin-like protein